MPEDLAGQPEEGQEAPAATPALPVADIEKIQADYDARIKGFQKLVSDRDARLDEALRELSELKTAGLSDDERDQLRQKQLEVELEKTRFELELERASRDFPDEMPWFRKLMDAESYEDQLKLLRELRQPAPAQAPEASPEAPDVADILPDQPPRPPAVSSAAGMTDDLADRILGAFAKMR